MVHLFEGNTADELWQNALQAFETSDAVQAQPSRNGPTKEILHAVFTLSDPRQHWVLSRRPAINPAFVIAEFVWIIRGRNDSQYVNFWNRELPKYAGYSEYYHGAYGHRLRQSLGFDQLERAYHVLKNAPDTRQVVLQIWNSIDDFPDSSGQPVSPDIPCNITSLLKVRDNKLEWMQILRSNDMFRGVPYNFVQFASLQEVVAGWLGIEVGSYNHYSDSLHIYDHDLGTIDRVPLEVVSELRNPDSLSLPKNESDRVFQELDHLIEDLMRSDLLLQELTVITREARLPKAFKNLFFIVAAEAARRRRWFLVMEDLFNMCSNPVLRYAWNSWFDRISSNKPMPQNQEGNS